ncbi:hypothetical protein N7541_009736 [Penicillium brevicompactum]|uniref:Uncharacterized protein n=1 Tax=Penicillium brevicompactum TaxID=5074 RepID=A0A9W9UGZ2_PENBR|nr:hypothetical protein N7541_009736 [Penicillium brevicompactum]
MIPPSTKWLPPGASDLVVGPSENAACSNPSRAETERCSRSYKYKYCLDLFGRLAPSSIAPRRVAIHDLADASAIRSALATTFRGGKFDEISEARLAMLAPAFEGKVLIPG